MVKKRNIYIFIVLISLVSLLFIFFQLSQDNNKGSIATSNKNIASYKGIKAGDIFQEDNINNLLGYPKNTSYLEEYIVNEYKSSSEFRSNQILVKDNTIEIIKEVINPDDNRNNDIDNIKNQYGMAKYILYEKISYSSFDLYVYPDNGLAYLGHEDGTVLEIWYFLPTDIDTFIIKWAPNYQKEPFLEQTGH